MRDMPACVDRGQSCAQAWEAPEGALITIDCATRHVSVVGNGPVECIGLDVI